MKIDQIPRHILQVLSGEGRISNIDLAARVGLSPSACLRRVQELERSGVIKGYRAVLDQGALDRAVTAYVTVGWSDHSKASQESFERAVQHAPEVREYHNITGNVEYFLRVEVADLEAFKTFHTDVLGVLPQVNALTSYFAISSPKDERA